VLCFPFAGALLQQQHRPEVFSAQLALALLLRDERVVLPFLSVPKPTRMSWDRSRSMMVRSLELLLGIMIVRRRRSSVVRLQVPLRGKQGVHQLSGMRRKHIHFVPRKSVVVSKRCDMRRDAICAYSQQSLRPHYRTKIKRRYMYNDLCLIPRTWTIPSCPSLQLSPQFGFGRASRLDPALPVARATTFSMTRPRKHHQSLNYSTASID
jgi:hypothetical protein